jgi:hypothetical protein
MSQLHACREMTYTYFVILFNYFDIRVVSSEVLKFEQKEIVSSWRYHKWINWTLILSNTFWLSDSYVVFISLHISIIHRPSYNSENNYNYYYFGVLVGELDQEVIAIDIKSSFIVCHRRRSHVNFYLMKFPAHTQSWLFINSCYILINFD